MTEKLDYLTIEDVLLLWGEEGEESVVSWRLSFHANAVAFHVACVTRTRPGTSY